MSIELATITLARGGHPDRTNGLCIMEAIAWLANEAHTDAPDCVCPVIRGILIRVNDRMRDDAARTTLLLPYAARVIGTAGDRGATQRRAYMVADWAVREMAPLALDAAGQSARAATLRALPPIVDPQAARAAAAAAADAAAYDQFIATHLPPLMERLLTA